MEFTIQFRANLIANSYQKYLSKGTRVLDVGCGNGIVAHAIAEKTGATITGTDIMEYLKMPIPYVQMTKEDALPFPDNNFDVAMINDALHHMTYEQQAKVIREALRVAPLVLAFELDPTPLTRFLDWLSNKIHNWRMRIPFTFRTDAGWSEFLKKEGYTFEVVPVERPAFYPVTNFVLVVRR